MIEGYSKPRNPAIANAFAYMKIIENGEPVFQEYSVNAETMVCLIQNLLILMVIFE